MPAFTSVRPQARKQTQNSASLLHCQNLCSRPLGIGAERRVSCTKTSGRYCVQQAKERQCTLPPADRLRGSLLDRALPHTDAEARCDFVLDGLQLGPLALGAGG